MYLAFYLQFHTIYVDFYLLHFVVRSNALNCIASGCCCCCCSFGYIVAPLQLNTNTLLKWEDHKEKSCGNSEQIVFCTHVPRRIPWYAVAFVYTGCQAHPWSTAKTITKSQSLLNDDADDKCVRCHTENRIIPLSRRNKEFRLWPKSKCNFFIWLLLLRWSLWLHHRLCDGFFFLSLLLWLLLFSFNNSVSSTWNGTFNGKYEQYGQFCASHSPRRSIKIEWKEHH